MVVIVVPPFAESQQGDDRVVARPVVRRVPARAPDVGQGVDQHRRMEDRERADDESPDEPRDAADREARNAVRGERYPVVAIDPAQIKGVLPLPIAQLRSALPALANPGNLRKSVALTKKQFKFGFGNELSDDASDELFEKWAIPAAARPLFEAATANFSLHSQAHVDTANETRGPLLLISGLKDHTVPDVSTRSTLKQYRHSAAVTELKQFEGRGHSLTIDGGWGEVAEAILQWLKVQGL